MTTTAGKLKRLFSQWERGSVQSKHLSTLSREIWANKLEKRLPASDPSTKKHLDATPLGLGRIISNPSDSLKAHADIIRKSVTPEEWILLAAEAYTMGDFDASRFSFNEASDYESIGSAGKVGLMLLELERPSSGTLVPQHIISTSISRATSRSQTGDYTDADREMDSYFQKKPPTGTNDELQAAKMAPEKTSLEAIQDSITNLSDLHHTQGENMVKNILGRINSYDTSQDSRIEGILTGLLARLVQAGPLRDTEKAQGLNARAADLGVAAGVFGVAEGLFRGRGGAERSLVGAFKMFTKAAESGHAHALAQVGHCLSAGTGCPKPDLSAALRAYRAAAFLGEHVAQLNYAFFLEHGWGGAPSNAESAAFWFHEAASRGLCDAQRNYGRLILPPSLVTFDSDAAITSKPEQSNPREEAISEIGLEWLHKAAKRGDDDALVHIGSIVYTRDPLQSLECFRKAANRNHLDAEYLYGKILYHGAPPQVEKDQDQALRWLRRAAMRSHPAAVALLSQHRRQEKMQ